NNIAKIPSFVPKAASVPAGSRNRPTSVPAGSRNRPTSVPAGSRNRPTSVPAGRPFTAGLGIITKCIWMREDGELLLSPQQVVLGEFKGQICNGDPRTMADLINLHVRNQNGNVVVVRAENNGNGNNENHIRCYNYKGMAHYAKNYTIRPRKRDVAYLQTQLLIAQKKEVGTQLQTEEFDLTVAAADCEKIEEVNANCILMVNLQQALTLGIHANIAPIYDSDGSAEVHQYKNCYNNEIYNMFCGNYKRG
ncbi:hypothetical protein Tco_1140205, partial [Tanacetum coccineum]